MHAAGGAVRRAEQDVERVFAGHETKSQFVGRGFEVHQDVERAATRWCLERRD